MGESCLLLSCLFTNRSRFYNKTPYSGLEIHISNSYANPLLQVLHFTPLIRNLALQHTATACVREECLLCELGFLFDMLEKAEGSICQATNLLKTFSSDPQGTMHSLATKRLLTFSSWTSRIARRGFPRGISDYDASRLDSIPA